MKRIPRGIFVAGLALPSQDWGCIAGAPSRNSA